MAEQLTLDGTRRPLAVGGAPVSLAEGAALLRGFALPYVAEIETLLEDIEPRAPFRHMVTPGGFVMSVGMTNAGALGWISDRSGYRYSPVDPLSGRPWPTMPDCFRRLATFAARESGFEGFVPDACLINRYVVGARMTLHQDKDELDFSAPIVSVSLGLPAVFLWGGLTRRKSASRILLADGDVVVWGGPARLSYHGVLPLKPGSHSRLGGARINLTFRKAG